MKRRILIQHLEKHDCELLREGGNHSVYGNHKASKISTVPNFLKLVISWPVRFTTIYKYLSLDSCPLLDL